MCKQYFNYGYEIDAAYTNADKFLAGSDKWHFWMDRAKELENVAKEHSDKSKIELD